MVIIVGFLYASNLLISEVKMVTKAALHTEPNHHRPLGKNTK